MRKLIASSLIGALVAGSGCGSLIYRARRERSLEPTRMNAGEIALDVATGGILFAIGASRDSSALSNAGARIAAGPFDQDDYRFVYRGEPSSPFHRDGKMLIGGDYQDSAEDFKLEGLAPASVFTCRKWLDEDGDRIIPFDLSDRELLEKDQKIVTADNELGFWIRLVGQQGRDLHLSFFYNNQIQGGVNVKVPSELYFHRHVLTPSIAPGRYRAEWSVQGEKVGQSEVDVE